MKLKSIPQTYEAIVFHDDIETCKNVQDFVEGTWAQLICNSDSKILSSIVGNNILSNGDIIYKDDNMCYLFKKSNGSHLFNKYFEVIDET